MEFVWDHFIFHFAGPGWAIRQIPSWPGRGPAGPGWATVLKMENSNNKQLELGNEIGIHIWDGNTTREFLDNRGLNHLPVVISVLDILFNGVISELNIKTVKLITQVKVMIRFRMLLI